MEADNTTSAATTNRKMRTIVTILISISAIMGIKDAMAENAAARLTAEGKEWNYDCTKYFGIKPLCTTPSKSLRFSGKTIKGGREYFVLTSSKNTADTVALIREEDGKVYVCADSPVLHMDYEAPQTDEYQVNDFKTEPGGKYKGLVSEPRGYSVCDIEVLKVDTVGIGGRSFRKQTVRPVSQYTDCAYDVVEGIGCLDEWFFLPGKIDYTTGQTNPHYSIISLKNVKDDEDYELFSINDIYPKPEPEFATTIREDRVWAYSVNGKEKRLKTGTPELTDYGYYYPVLDEHGDSLALMSEWRDYGRVERYGRGDPELLQQHWSDLDMYYGGYDVYRFGAEVGHKYRTIGLSNGPDRYKKLDVTVVSVDTVVIAGEKCRRQTLAAEGRPGEKFVAVEGIGINRGWLHLPAWGDKEAEEAIGVPVLTEVRDIEGNVIFKHEDFGSDAGVEEILTDNAISKDARMYDLNGREIRNPEPGTVYIQGGRKHVATRGNTL